MSKIREDLTPTGVTSVVEVQTMHFEDPDRGTLVVDVGGQDQSVLIETANAGNSWEVESVDSPPQLPARAPGEIFHVVEDERRFEIYRHDSAAGEPVLLIPRAGWR